MYPISPQFIEALNEGAEVVTRADVYKRGQKVYELPVTSGSVTDDATAAVRRRCSLEVSLGDQPELYVPGQQSEDNVGLWPNGTEIKLLQGFRHRTLGLELIPMGVFRVSRPIVTDNGEDLRLAVTGYDRSRAVARARFRDSYQVKHTDMATAIKGILMRQCAWLTEGDFEDGARWMRTDGYYGSTGYFVPRATFDRSDDPWKACTDMALAAGADLFFDVDGLPVLRPETDPSSEVAVFSYDEGEANLATAIQRDLDDEQAYNGVVCTGENSSLPTSVRAEIWDTDPLSATFYDPARPYDTDYGPVPYFMTSQFVENTAQALAAATAQFNRLRGIIENISIDAVANFAHQSNDVIHIKRNRVGVDGNYVLDAFTIQLGVGGLLNGTTRRRGTYS